jgi:hypothetical protein
LLRRLSEVLPVKSIILAGTLLLAAGCMEKHVTVTTTQRTETAAAGGQETREDAKELGEEANRRADAIKQTEAAQRVAQGAKDLETAIREGSPEAAERAGKALRQGGTKKKDDTGEQKPATATDTQR